MKDRDSGEELETTGNVQASNNKKDHSQHFVKSGKLKKTETYQDPDNNSSSQKYSQS